MTILTTPLHGGDIPHHSNTIPSVGLDAPVVVGVVAEYEDVTSVLEAAKKVRDSGYKHWDVYSPFPIHGIDAAMGIKPTILPWMVLAGGISGCLFGLVMTAWINGAEPIFPWPLNWVNFQGYAYLTSGKPLWSIPATIPVVFECTILFSALTAVFGMLLLNRLPMLYHPLFKLEMFRRATSDRFFIALDAGDPKFDHGHASELLQGTKPSKIETIED